MRLTSKKVAKLVRRGVRGKYPDGHGLYLQVQNPNNASWFFRYERAGVEKTPGLGPVHTVGLGQARDRAKALRLQLLDGIDPIEAKQAAKAERVKQAQAAAVAAAKAMTFAAAARGFFEQHSHKWRNLRHAKQWSTSIAEYVEPIIGALPVGDIDRTLVLKVLEQNVEARRGSPAGSLWLTRPETARRLRGRLEEVLNYAKARGYRDRENPAAWDTVKHILPAPKKLARAEHHPALAFSEIPQFMSRLRTRTGNAARALEFTILCAARTGETLGAKWGEIDFDAKVWTVPGERMKVGDEHRVPLSDRAVEILKALPRRKENDFVFIGGDRAGGLTPPAMMMVLRRLDNSGVTVHGFRSSFRDWAGETTAYPADLCESALAHIQGKTRRAYERGDKFPKRRRLMADWAGYCASSARKATADVVPIGAATGAA